MPWKLFLFGLLFALISKLIFALIFKKIDVKMPVKQNKINSIIMRMLVLIIWLITGIVGTTVTNVIHNNAIDELNKYIILVFFGVSYRFMFWDCLEVRLFALA